MAGPAYKYKGHPSDQDAHYGGVPKRDLTADEFEVLTEAQRAAVLTGALYEPVTPAARASVKEARAEATVEAEPSRGKAPGVKADGP